VFNVVAGSSGLCSTKSANTFENRSASAQDMVLTTTRTGPYSIVAMIK
jgi:hypothetical protein